jgi:hypothetical protein
VKFRAFLCCIGIAASCAALPFDAGAQAPKPPAQSVAPQPAQIDRNGVLILIRSTILALDQANKTGNYTVLRDLGAPGFQANTAAAPPAGTPAGPSSAPSQHAKPVVSGGKPVAKQPPQPHTDVKQEKASD